MQGTLSCDDAGPRHVAIVMDGNGRWAQARGWPRIVGHRAGVEAVRRAVDAAARRGVATMTLFALSSDNWRRPPTEVAALFRLFDQHVRREAARCRENGVRLSVIGRRDRLPQSMLDIIADAESITRAGDRLHLRLAIDYSARDAILTAAASRSARRWTREQFARRLATAANCPGDWPDVDLLIRTGGEKRLSDYLLWECAYAELVFLDRMWPEFDEEDLADAIGEFHRRQRRFGGLAAAKAN